ncbi:MAG TPA: septal ring lytic transglycosylase RlpA family protein [Burkholderiales bacterium]
MKRMLFAAGALLALLGGCSLAPSKDPEPQAAPTPAPATKPAPPRAGGGYYKDDGPGDTAPPDLAAIPDAVPRPEPLHRFANRPYQVFGRDYVPATELKAFRERGVGSWYGRRYHGLRTSSGEPYDMYAMTAAHPTLPIPSYARVTNLANGRSVVVRINDRGPFLAGRVVDLSYTAAWKLGYIEAGSARVEVETVLPGAVLAAAAPAARPEAAPIPPAPATPAPAAPPPARPPAPAAAPATAPAPAAAPAPVAAAATPAVAGPGIYLQVGAFATPAGAEDLRERLKRDLDWLTQAIHVFPVDALHKLQIGPFQSREAARPVAERLRSELNFRPFTVVR